MNDVVDNDSGRDAGRLLIEASHLRLGYGQHVVLDRVGIEVRTGEFWFFLGTNGAGKSTMLKAILGLLPPQAGRLQRHIGTEQIGLVPQRCDFNASLPTTVREFVLFGLVGIKVSRRERRQRLNWALDRVDLRAWEHRNYWSLSGGQRQRALVARALVRRPCLLLADEPTNSLDLLAHDTLLDVLAELHRTQQLVVVMIAHDLVVAARYATHVALFHEGKILAGPAAIVFQSPTLQKIYRLPSDLCVKLTTMIRDRADALQKST